MRARLLLTLALAIGFLAVGPALAGSLKPPPGPVAQTRPADTCFDNTGNRFVDCGDGTIKDTETGYHWLKDAACTAPMFWAESKQFAAQLADGQCGLSDGSLPGDWRLPTLECPSGTFCAFADGTGEFASIFGTTCPSPGILNEAGTGCWSGDGDPFDRVISGRYWGSTVSSAPVSAFFAFLDGPGISSGPKTTSPTPRPWPVRLGQTAGDDNMAQRGSLDAPPGLVEATRPPDTCFDITGNRFVDCGDGTIKDTETGLYWLRNANCFGARPWANANQDLANLAHGQCGLTDGSLPGDWRLPTLACPFGSNCSGDLTTGELGVLLNLAAANGCTFPAVPDTLGGGCWTEGNPFSGVQSVVYWSATAYAASPSSAWGANLSSGGALTGSKTSGGVVWPVRGGP